MRTSILIFTFAIFLRANTYIEPIRIDYKIKIDGHLQDEIWKTAKAYHNFSTFQPYYGQVMSHETFVYSAYDENNLYFAFRCLNPNPDKILGTMTKRDNIYSEDWVMVLLDSFNDRESCYEFAVNPYGVQGDLMFNGNGDDPSHDFIWESAGMKTDTGYCVEIAIPLKSIRFQPGETVEMGIGFIRYSPLASEKGSYPAFDPEGGPLLTQLGKIHYKGLNYSRNIELLPSLTRNQKYSHEAGEFDQDFVRNDFGITTKIGLTPSLTMDATYNPDFSQIEADAGQVTANLRTAVYYQEKRPFFLEGSEKFNLAGARNFSSIRRAVHTRQIIDPVAGLKLSGKLGNNGSIASIIAVDESPKHDEDLINENAWHGVFRYKNSHENGTYYGGLYAAKVLGEETLHTTAADIKYQINGKNRIESNMIYTQYKEHQNFDNSYNLDMEYSYDDEKYSFGAGYHDISKNFQMASGLIGRDGIRTFSNFNFRNFYPQESIFQKIQLGLLTDVRRDLYDQKNEYYIELNYELYLPHNTNIMNWVEYATEVYADNVYRMDEFGIFFRTQITKQLSFFALNRTGKGIWYDEDDPLQTFRSGTEVEIEFKPSSNFQTSFNAVQSYFENLKSGKLLMDYKIFRNRTTFQINKYLFLRSTIEYNTYEEQVLTDFLVSYTYIPGTVLHVGYGSMFERTTWDSTDKEYRHSEDFLEMDRGLFMKASYNWRL
ncbi:MAG: carbohydrate binding family 9 domain-containing protein [Candidatus Marinimicrobia bacterium]|nr:carbohydrate binding family 9 domain-containing protein [Candidatus Neomarinimicrobiota bacterium]